MTKYAIVSNTGEFYPDPIYTDRAKALTKIDYLSKYRSENGMPSREYDLEILTPEREAQHKKEWSAWVSMID